jgi:hypothetical protein
MLTYYDLNIQPGFLSTRQIPKWFKFLQDILLVNSGNRVTRQSYPHRNNSTFDFSPPTKYASIISFVLGWNFGHNKPFVGRLLKTEEHYVHIMYVIPTNGSDDKTLLSECSRCELYDNHTYIPYQTINKDHKCFFIVPINHCFQFPTYHNTNESSYGCSWSINLLNELVSAFIRLRTIPQSNLPALDFIPPNAPSYIEKFIPSSHSQSLLNFRSQFSSCTSLEFYTDGSLVNLGSPSIRMGLT